MFGLVFGDGLGEIGTGNSGNDVGLESEVVGTRGGGLELILVETDTDSVSDLGGDSGGDGGALMTVFGA